MEFIYKVLICSLPFLASYAGFYWLGKKILRTPHAVWRAICLALVAAGVVFTTWQLIKTYSNLGDSSFNFMVIIVNVFVMALISIFLAFSEPEK